MPQGNPALVSSRIRAMRQTLLAWYDREQRDLPWRRTRDPYRIWVSEIMLQQTRVGAVLEHYAEFFRRFPDLKALANAEEAEVLAAWSGLGYYRRARALHRAARVVVQERGGRLPRTADEWRELPGIGRYTAAAIASIAFGEAAAVVDGNVERVLRRFFDWKDAAPAHSWDTAAKLLSRERPGDFNQAMMELGATICVPGQPRCGECAWKRYCAHAESAGLQRPEDAAIAGKMPAPRAKAKREVRQSRYLFLQRASRVLLRRRKQSESLMPGMWELPPANGEAGGEPSRFRHAILDTDYHVQVYTRTPAKITAKGGMRWVPQSELPRVPLTGLCRKVLRHFGML